MCQVRSREYVPVAVIIAALAVSLLVLAGCKPVTAPPQTEATAAAVAETAAEATAVPTDANDIPVIAIEVTADGVTMPEDVPSGIVTFAYQMAEDAPGMPEFARLNDGVTMDQLMAAMQEDVMAAVPLVSLLGNTEKTVGDQVTYDLQPGEHISIIFPAEEGALPLLGSFTAGEASAAAEPEADITAQLADFAFILPDEIAAGPQTWLIENTGKQWHEMGIVKLNEGTGVAELLEMLAQMDEQSGPPPFEDIAFWSPMSASRRAWVTWDLPAGEYTVICFLPDLNGDMSAHAAHGMVRTVVVK